MIDLSRVAWVRNAEPDSADSETLADALFGRPDVPSQRVAIEFEVPASGAHGASDYVLAFGLILN